MEDRLTDQRLEGLRRASDRLCESPKKRTWSISIGAAAVRYHPLSTTIGSINVNNTIAYCFCEIRCLLSVSDKIMAFIKSSSWLDRY